MDANSATVQFTCNYHLWVDEFTVNPDVLWAGGAGAIGMIALNEPAPLAGVTVPLGYSGPAGVSVPTNVIIPGGSASNTFSVTADATATAGTGTITATGPDGTTQSVNIEVSAGQVVLVVTSSTPAGSPDMGALASGEPVTITVYVRMPAPWFGGFIALSLSAWNLSVDDLPSSLPLRGGATSAQFTITPVALGSIGTGKYGNGTITASYEGTGTISLGVWSGPLGADSDQAAVLTVGRGLRSSNCCGLR